MYIIYILNFRYPQICESATHKLQGIDFFSEKMAFIEKKLRGSICETVSRKFETPPELLVTRLSFSRVSKLLILTQVHRKVHRKSIYFVKSALKNALIDEKKTKVQENVGVNGKNVFVTF